MSAVLAFLPQLTLEEFLDWQLYQEEKFEWDGTQPVAMVGETLRHSLLASRVHDALRAKLLGGPCAVFFQGPRVMTEHGTRVRHPDVVVTCSPFRWSDRVVPNPVFILEVLSESTAPIDRGVKRAEYTALSSLARYVMLAQDAPIALVCDRAGGFAERQEHEALALPEFGLTLPFAEFYAGLLD
jgi:Uma2 family endonuclease